MPISRIFLSRRTPNGVVVAAVFACVFLLPGLGRAQPVPGIPGFPRPGLLRALTPDEPQETVGDLVDRHAPIARRDVARNLEQAQKLIEDRKWPAAIETLQFVIDLPQDALLPGSQASRPTSSANLVERLMNAAARLSVQSTASGNVLVPLSGLLFTETARTVAPVPSTTGLPVKRRAELLLRDLPEEGRMAYLNTYGKVAEDLLAQARRNQNFADLCGLARRFWNTPAGQAAADDVATLLMDSGDAVGAAVWFAAMYEDRAEITRTPQWRGKAARLWRLLGREQEAHNIEAGAPLTTAATTTTPAPRPPETPQASAKPAGSRPLLLEQWSAPLSQREDVQEQIRDLKTDLQGDHVAFPAMTPVAAAGRVAVRTLAGVEVRDANSGRLLFRNDERFTAEGLMGSSSGLDEVGSAVTRLHHWDDPELHPLASLLYRDSVLGRVTTDGSQLFLIEQRVPLLSDDYDFYVAAHPEGAAALQWDHSFNAVSSYDFETGRRLWSIGGPASDEPFAPALTGVYFFGPPTPAGRELFVIGAHEEEVNLYCLDAATGQPLWSQLIAQYDNVKIVDDIVRQMWSCSPTITAGLVICPTNAGWLTAVDRLRRRIVWCTRYSNEEVADRYQPHYSLESIDNRWPATAPLLAGGIVVAAPTEHPDEARQADPQLIGIDALTGRPLWRRERGAQVAVAGVFNNRLIIIEREQITAWSLKGDSSPEWSTAYPGGQTPCGSGIVAEGCYWLPFEEGTVVGFRLSDGNVDAVLKNPELRGKLGNLLASQDRVLSAGPAGIFSLWQQKPLEDEIANRLAKNPDDIEGRLLSARRFAGLQDWPAALRDLADSHWPTEGIDETVAAQAAALRWTCLTAMLKDNPAGHETEWELLHQLANDDAKKGELSRLEIDRAIAVKNWSAAIEACWSMMDTPDGEIREGSSTVARDAWIAGRFDEIRRQADADARKRLDSRIQDALEVADDVQIARLAEQVFPFHPQARKRNLAKADEALAAGRILEADVRLRALLPNAAPEERASLLQRLVSLWVQAGSLADARAAAQSLADLGNLALDDGTSAANWGRDWLASHPPESDPPEEAPWSVSRCEMIRSGVEFGPGYAIDVVAHGRPANWFQTRRLAVESAWDGLASIRERDGKREWLTPLADAPGYEGEPMPTVVADGAALLLSYRGILHALSPIDRRELWTWTFPPRFARPIEYAWGPEQLSTAAAEQAGELQGQFQTHGVFRREGILLSVSGRSLAILGQRELVVLDLLTGQRRWSRGGVSPDSMLAVDEEAVCVSRMSDRGEPAAFRLGDGVEMATGKYQSNLARAVAVVAGRLLITEETFGLFARPIRISAVHPRTGEADWQQVFQPGTVFGWGLENELLSVQPDGKLSSIETVRGARTELGQIPRESLRNNPRIHMAADGQRVYVVIGVPGGDEFSYLSLPCIRVQGQLLAFDRASGKMAWPPRAIRGSNLVLNQFRRLPVLIFAGYRTEELSAGPDSRYVQKIELMLLDKSTGREVLNWSGATIGGSPSSLVVDPANQRIDILSYNERYRFQFKKPAETSPSGQ